MIDIDKFFDRTMNFIIDTTIVSEWPRLLRRAFVLTIPISGLLYVLYFLIAVMATVLLGGTWILIETLHKIWEE